MIPEVLDSYRSRADLDEDVFGKWKVIIPSLDLSSAEGSWEDLYIGEYPPPVGIPAPLIT